MTSSRPDSDAVASLVLRLGLEPHPEGGYYREIYRSGSKVRTGGIHRASLTSIYYLLGADDRSRWHRVDADEVWHFYEGDPLELIQFDPDLDLLDFTLLGSLDDGGRRVHVVPAGHWQAARPTGAYALTGCTVAPGFEFSGFRFVADLPGHEAAFETTLEPFRPLL